MFEAIPAILHEMELKHLAMMYSWNCYSQCSNGQNTDDALFKSIKYTNFMIKDAAFLHVVHIMQHPTSRPSTLSTQNTMVNAPKKNLSLLPAGKYGKSMKRSTPQCHQVNEGMTGVDAE